MVACAAALRHGGLGRVVCDVWHESALGRQDFALQGGQIWTRVLRVANSIEVKMNRITAADCDRCA